MVKMAMTVESIIMYEYDEFICLYIYGHNNKVGFGLLNVGLVLTKTPRFQDQESKLYCSKPVDI